MNNIFISTTTFAKNSDAPINILENSLYEVEYNQLTRKLNKDELISFAQHAIGIIAGTENYPIEVLNQLTNLRVISRLGVGMDNIDLEAASKMGIKVFRTEATPAPAVAELTLGLMLDVARKISGQNQSVKSGIWQKKMGNLLHGKTLGIVGLGAIGKTLVQLVKGFNFDILAFDMYHDYKFAKENKVTYCDMDALLTRSNIVSIHLNLNDETKGLMDKERLKTIKPKSILINTSRGEIIDEDALYDALKSRRLLGAGLDVFSEEPYTGPLVELENVVLTPHIGAYAKEIRIQMEMQAVENLMQDDEWTDRRV